MKVLVDTSVWSAALRRSKGIRSPVTLELQALVTEHRAELIGPIRQEILSGIREEAQFERLRKHLAAFPDFAIRTEDYVTAAQFFNRCRERGIQGSNTDFLICAVAARNGLAVFTTDQDFLLYARHLPIALHPLRDAEQPPSGRA